MAQNRSISERCPIPRREVARTGEDRRPILSRRGARLTGLALSLTLVLVAFFIIEGIASIMYAVDHRRQLTGSWGWMLLSGIIDLILAAIILAGLPGTAVWALGLLVGINMLFGGGALIAMALAARQPG